MQTVYLVFTGEYSSRTVAGVFGTKEAADAYMAKAMTDDWEEHVLDAASKEVWERRWISEIALDTGDIIRQEEFPRLITDDQQHPDPAYIYPYSNPHIHAESFVSQEHANKLAAEARQKHLRESAEPIELSEECCGPFAYFDTKYTGTREHLLVITGANQGRIYDLRRHFWYPTTLSGTTASMFIEGGTKVPIAEAASILRHAMFPVAEPETA